MIAGTLEIQLMANIARLASDMQKAQQTVDNTMSGIQSAVGFAQKALGALGIGLSINYFKNFVAGAIDAQDRLQDLSNRSGLSVTALAGLDHATKMTGTSLDVMVKGLKTVSTQLYEAQQGGKSAQDMFSGLGISVLDTNGALKSSDRVLVEVADRFATMTSETEKTAVATKLFGKAGTDLIPMLNEGSDAIAAMVAEGQRLNPVTEESARQAASFNDNVDRLKTAVTGAGMSIVNNMLPGLVKFSDAVFEFTQNGKLAEWLDKVKTAAELLAIAFVSRMVPAIVASGLAFLAAATESIAYQAALARMAGVSYAAATAQGVLSAATGAMGAAMALVGGPIGVAALAAFGLYTYAESVREANGDTRTFTETLEDQLEVMKKITDNRTNVYVAGLGIQTTATSTAKTAIQDLLDQEVKWEYQTQSLSSEIKGHTRVMEIAAQATYARARSLDVVMAKQDAHVLAMEQYLKVQEEERTATIAAQRRVSETIIGLQNEQIAIGMTARAQAVFNAVTREYSAGTAPDKIAAIAEETARLYDLTEALRVSAQTAEETARVSAQADQDRTRAAEIAAQATADAWRETHSAITGAIMDTWEQGGSFFGRLGDIGVATAKRIAAEWLAMKAMNLFGIPTPGGSAGSAGGSAVGSIASSAASSAIGSAAVRSGIGQFVGGAAGTATGVAAGTMGPPTAAAAAGSGIGATIAGAAGAAGSAISGAGSAMMAFAVANPVIAAALAAAALAATLSKEETPSGNAGFLIRDLAGGGDGRTFDVEPFASGFDPVGFARREDQGAAVGVIDTFRQYDAALTSIAKAAGIDVNYNSNTFGGFDEKGRGNGLFFGAANEDGRGSSVPIEQQLDQYVTQWIKGLGGQVNQSLINDVLSAGSADEMIKRAGMIAGIDGSHATGLDYVPFDGYVAELHRGERVVPASENVGDGTMSAMVAELRAMRAELIDIRKNSMDSYNLLDKWDNDPLTVQVAA